MKIQFVSHIIFFFLLSCGISYAGSDRKDSFSINADIQQIPSVEKPVLFSSDVQPQKKSVVLAAVLSLILPGAGEYYADGYHRGKYFTISEATLWGTYASFEIYGNAVQKDAHSYAKINAGIDENGKDDLFYVNIGNFMNTDDYNDKKMQDRTPDLLYNSKAGYGWQWNSDDNRQQYRAMRVSSDNILYNTRYVVGAIIVNHLVSAISAGKAASDYNKSIASKWEWRIAPEVTMLSGIPDGIQLRFETNF